MNKQYVDSFTTSYNFGLLIFQKQSSMPTVTSLLCQFMKCILLFSVCTFFN